MFTYLRDHFAYRMEYFASLDCIFSMCAVIGLTFFFLRAITMAMGSLFEHDGGSDHHHDFSEPAFKFLTFHTLTGFLMVFGLIGLGMKHQLNYPDRMTLGIAFLAGFLMMLLVAIIFYAASHLTSEGAVFRIQEAVGFAAVVYQRIETGSEGKIQVVAHGITRELAARSKHGESIESFEHVRIVDVVDNNTVYVVRVSREG